MSDQPRLALATPASGPEPAAASLALMAGLASRRWRVQHFRSRACPVGTEAAGRATGLPGRHLDAWLMPPDVCRTVFAQGARRADLALVEGTFAGAGATSFPDGNQQDRPGDLGPIARALDLPTVAVVPCRGLDDFHLPRLPHGVDAILLDGLDRPEEFDSLCRMVGLMFKAPVLGAIEALPEVRAALLRAPSDRPPLEAIEQLGASFLRYANLPMLRALAASRPLPDPPPGPPIRCRGGRPFRVAYAQDEAFGGYYPDTLETLEALGADLVEFSPLRDEALPEEIDLVILGCGYPDRHADALAGNFSLIAALRAHVCRGHRIYAEGGGAAYLGRSLILDGRPVPAAGILPFDAELRRDVTDPSPVTRTLSLDSWLGPRGTVVRGYRSGRWRLRPAPDPGDCPARSGALTPRREAFVRHHAVGSLIHLHLAALPEVVSAFAGPHRASLTLPRALP